MPDAERLTALLRLVAVPVLLIGEVYVPSREPTEGRFFVVLALFAFYALGTLVLAAREATPPAHWMAVADIACAGALTYSSGGGFSQLRFAFLFPVVAVAFRGRPLLTAGVAAAATAVYVAQSAPHPSRSSSGALSFVLVQAAYIAWLGFALALLSLLLSRRDRALRLLSAQRQRLVAEALTAEERERRVLAQDLHDGAIQNLLAARHDLDGPAREAPDGPEARAHATITATVAQLRGTVADLHPYLLEQAGLTAAIGQAARAAAERAGFALELDLEESAPASNDRAVLRCTSELLSNVVRHARAAHVTVQLRHEGAVDRVRVQDDGVGFDPVAATASVHAGHIGLVSLRERAEALGGALTLASAPGAGTTATVTIPRGELA
ncbi:MAG: two-component system, NarL family, sensor kinase [Gaiellales bacterium]|jgi:two-component system NarL family sensor kinase|nr:two-component system, NarL family, sensor kinase [Gaiellales bacterium]